MGKSYGPGRGALDTFDNAGIVSPDRASCERLLLHGEQEKGEEEERTLW